MSNGILIVWCLALAEFWKNIFGQSSNIVKIIFSLYLTYVRNFTKFSEIKISKLCCLWCKSSYKSLWCLFRVDLYCLFVQTIGGHGNGGISFFWSWSYWSTFLLTWYDGLPFVSVCFWMCICWRWQMLKLFLLMSYLFFDALCFSLLEQLIISITSYCSIANPVRWLTNWHNLL